MKKYISIGTCLILLVTLTSCMMFTNKSSNKDVKEAEYEVAIEKLTSISQNPAKESSNKKSKTSNAVSAKKTKAFMLKEKGLELHNEGKPHEAIAMYDEAIKLNPEFLMAYNNRGVAKTDIYDYEGAFEDYSKAISINPKFAMAYSNRGHVRMVHLNETKEAIDDFDKAIELNPRFANAYLNRGIAYCDLAMYEEAIEDLDMALEINPKMKSAKEVREYAMSFEY